MAPTVVNSTVILNESLDLLRTKCQSIQAVYRGYDNRFGDSASLKPGTSLQVRKPVKYSVGTGKKLSVQDTVEETATVTCSTQVHVAGPAFTSEQKAMNVAEFTKTYLDPAMSIIAAKIDNMILQHAAESFHQHVGTCGTTPASDVVILEALAKLDLMNAPMDGERYALITPTANASLVHGFVGLYNPASLISEQFKSGYLKSSLGLNIAQTNNIHRITMGTRSGGAILTDGATVTEGISMLHIDGFGGATETIKKGEKFTITGVNSVTPEMKVDTGSLMQFTVMQDFTASGSEGDLYFSPAIYSTGARQNVTALPVANGTNGSTGELNFAGTAVSTSYPHNIIMHKNALALVTADLPLPKNGVVEAKRDKLDNISMRYIEFYDGENDEWKFRFDVFCGVSTMYADLGVVLFG
jgi:hypothetical protein